MPETVTSLATEIYTELGCPSNVSVLSIELWIKGNIGRTKTFLSKEYEIVDDGIPDNFSPELDAGSKLLLKTDYELYYYNLKVNELLGAAGYDVQSVESDGAVVRTIDKNQLSKTYLQFLSQLKEARKDLINFYRNDNHQVKKVYSEDAYYTNYSNTFLTFNRVIQ